MKSLKQKENRGSVRRKLFHFAKLKIEDGEEQECLVLDISEGGLRLYVGAFNVPDRFLLAIGDCAICESLYEVVWRRGRELGAKFVSLSSFTTPVE